MSTSESDKPLYAGTENCKCGWLLPAKALISITVICDTSSSVTLKIHCPVCGKAYFIPSDEFDLLVIN